MKIHHVRAKVGALAAFGVASFAIFLYLFSAAGGKLRVHSPYRANVLVPEAFQLVANSDVRMAGVKVGRVQKITNQGTAGKLTIELEKKYAPLYRDSRVIVRTKTLVGENYLEVIPGHPSAGEIPDKGTAPLALAKEAVPVDRVLSTLDPQTRRRVASNLRTFGASLDGRGEDLNATLASLLPTVRSAGQFTSILARQRGRVAALVDDAGTVMSAIGSREADLQGLVRNARTTAQVVAARDARLGEIFDRLPGAMRQARESLATLSGFSARATPVVADLQSGVAHLAPAIRDLAPAAAQARDLSVDLTPALTRLDSTLPALQRLADVLPPAATGVEDLLRQANPFLGYLRPYAPDLTSFFANMGSAFTTDAMGYFGHVHALANEKSLKTWSPAQRTALDALTKAGIVGKLHNQDVNPYPKPGTMGDPKPWDGVYPKIEADPR